MLAHFLDWVEKNPAPWISAGFVEKFPKLFSESGLAGELILAFILQGAPEKEIMDMNNKKLNASSSLLALITQGLRTGHLRKAATTLVFAATTLTLNTAVRAEETTSEKVGKEVNDVKRAVKKKSRAAKKNIRDATGNSSTLEDLKDGARNAGDAVSDKAEEVKNKVD